jgi:hypothetical protein
MKMMTSTTPTMLATVPAWMESAPSSAPTVRSSRIEIGARQGARAQQQREVARRLHREAAGDDAAAAEDRLADHRRADHLVVEHDGEGLADILAGGVAEAARAGGVELEADHRLVVLEGGLRVGQHVPADHDALAHDISALAATIALLVLRRQDLVAGRQAAAARLLDGDAGIDELKCQLGGAAEQSLDVLGIVDARQLHQDAALPLALDRRLLGAGLVDAAADDLDRTARRPGADASRSRPGCT